MTQAVPAARRRCSQGLAGSPRKDARHEHHQHNAPKDDADLYLQQSKFAGCFASGLSAAEAALAAATQRPLAASAASEASGTPAWKTIASWAVVGTTDRVIPPALLTFMARRAGARVVRVSAGHLSLVSRPKAVATVIVSAARAVGH